MKRYMVFRGIYYEGYEYQTDLDTISEIFNIENEYVDYWYIIDIKTKKDTDIDNKNHSEYTARFNEAYQLVLILTKLGYYKDIRRLLFEKCFKYTLHWNKM